MARLAGLIENELHSAAVRVFRVVRVPCFKTRIIRNNFGYNGLEPELAFVLFGPGFFGCGFGFFKFGLRVSGNLPTHSCHKGRLTELLPTRHHVGVGSSHGTFRNCH